MVERLIYTRLARTRHPAIVTLLPPAIEMALRLAERIVNADCGLCACLFEFRAGGATLTSQAARSARNNLLCLRGYTSARKRAHNWHTRCDEGQDSMGFDGGILDLATQ